MERPQLRELNYSIRNWGEFNYLRRNSSRGEKKKKAVKVATDASDHCQNKQQNSNTASVLQSSFSQFCAVLDHSCEMHVW